MKRLTTQSPCARWSIYLSSRSRQDSVVKIRWQWRPWWWGHRVQQDEWILSSHLMRGRPRFRWGMAHLEKSSTKLKLNRHMNLAHRSGFASMIWWIYRHWARAKDIDQGSQKWRDCPNNKRWFIFSIVSRQDSVSIRLHPMILRSIFLCNTSIALRSFCDIGKVLNPSSIAGGTQVSK